MANKFKRAGSGNWSTDASWSTTSGGAADTVAPTAADDVFLDASSGDLTIDAASVCRSINCTGYVGVLTHNAFTLSIGDATAGASNIALKFVAGMTYTLANATTSAISFITTSATVQTVDFAGKTSGNVTYNASSNGSWQMIGQHTTTGTVTLTQGALDVNGQTCSWGVFDSNNSNVRALTLGAANITFTVTTPSGFWNVTTSTNMTLSAASSNLILGSISASTRTFAGGGLTYGSLTYIIAGSAGQLNITGSNTFTNLNFSDASNARQLSFTAGTTTTILGHFNVRGTAGKLMTIASVTTAQHIISKASGVIGTLDYLSIRRSTAQGGATWYAGANSVDEGIGPNTGWIFTDRPGPAIFKYIKALSGLVAYYPLDEASGDAINYAPATAGSMDGVVSGATQAQSGLTGSSYRFDGANDAVTATPSVTAIDSLTEVSVFFITKINGNGGGGFGRIIAKGPGAVGYWDINTQGGNIVQMNIDFATTDLTRRYNILYGAVRNVLFTYNNGTVAVDSVNLYLDGVLQNAALSIDAVGARGSDSSAFVIGNRTTDTARSFDGLLQHVAVFNRVLTAEEAARLSQLASAANNSNNSRVGTQNLGSLQNLARL